MHPSSAPVPTTKTRLRIAGRWLFAVVATCTLALLLFSPANQILEPELDSSNYGTYAWFTAHGLQYGTEIIPMVGPLGFVPYGHFYAGHLFGERLFLEALTKLALGALLVWFFRRSGSGWVRWAWLASVVFMAPALPDVPYDLASLFAGLCLLDPEMRSRRRVDVALAGLLALLTLFKGTQTQLALLVLGLVLGRSLLTRDLRRFGWLLGAYVLSLTGLLLAAGQNPLNFPAYVRGMLELSSGYNNAMGINEPFAEFLVGAGALVALLLMAGIALVFSRREMRQAPAIVLLGAFTFVQWKHGYVRADDHVFFFFDYACIAAPTFWLWSFHRKSGRLPLWSLRLGAVLACVAAMCGHWADGEPSITRHRWLLRYVPYNLAVTCRQLAGPVKAKADLSARLDHNRYWHELPLTKTRVGNATIDFYGFNQGYLLLNRLNYHPRPMGGGAFNVYSPWLLDQNFDAIADPARRPEYFLVQLATIDDRVITQDDSTSLRALLALYQPVDFENGMVLFARNGRNDVPTPRLVSRQRLVPGETITPPELGPDELLAMEADLPLNLLGRARALLYRPPMAFMDLAGKDIAQPEQRRVIPGMFARPVLLDPVIENTFDLVSLYTSEPGKQLKGIKISTEIPALFDTSAMEVRFYAIPRPATVTTANPILKRFAFTASAWVPSEKDAPGSHLRRVGGMDVRVLDAPASIRYPLEGNEHTVRLIYGIDPDAYIKGKTDGVEFLVDLERPEQAPQALFSNLLKPATRPEDRPFQAAEIVLPPHPPGSTLVFRTDIGPDNDGAWDWGFFAGVDCKSGDFIPEQFPGFGRLPATVIADHCGTFPRDGHPIFLLHPPGRMTFRLQGDESALIFQAGLLPGAYTSGGSSDGIDIFVTLREPGGEPRTIHIRNLNPRDRPRDRGDQMVRIPLPAAPRGSDLTLAVSPGPANNTSWDWSYLANLHFE